MDIQMIRTIDFYYRDGLEIEPTNDELILWQIYGMPDGVIKRSVETQVVPIIKVRTKKEWEKMFERIAFGGQRVDKVVITNL